MAITIGTTLRNALADATDDAVNAGSGAGKILILTSGNTTLATFTLSDPAFGAASTGVITGASFPKTVAASATGTAAKFRVTDSDDNTLWEQDLTQGTGANQIDNTSIASGQNITFNSLTFTIPAS